MAHLAACSAASPKMDYTRNGIAFFLVNRGYRSCSGSGAQLSVKAYCQLYGSGCTAFGKVTVVAPNEKAAGYFHIHTARDVAAIIPNAIAPIPFEVKQRDIDILFVGSLIELKQPQLFTDLAAQLTSHYPQLKATMIGKGPLLHELSAKVEQLKLPIILTGEMDRSAVHATMLRAKVLVHTSRYEGHSTVISEALACGCRVVCFAVGHTEHPAVQEVTGYTQMVEAVQQVIREGAPQTGAYPDEQREALHRYYQLYKG